RRIFRLLYASHTSIVFQSSASPHASDLRSPDPHSFSCSRCCSWDSVPDSRRRSISSSTTTPLAASFTGTSPKHALDTLERLVRPYLRQHNVSQSSAGLEDLTSSANCNYLTNAFKYLLSRLLLLPIFQFLYLHELIKTLHQLTYDEEDRARLNEVLSMLTKTRSSVERDLSKHPWVCLQLTRLISTGHLGGQFRSLYMDLLAGPNTPPSPINRNIPSSPSNATGSNGHSSPGVTGTQSFHIFGFPATSTSTDSIPSQQCVKADEIERLLGGREKLLSSTSGKSIMGDFVLEGRIHLMTESKRSSVEQIAYLFTGILFICKWQERRSALNPGSGQLQLLRVKHRIPLDAIHVNDIPPLVQPNLPAHVGNSGTITSSAVGAAVLAAASAGHGAVQHMAVGMAHPEFPNSSISNLIVSGMNGSITSQASLATIGGHGLAAYPYTFELEFVSSPLAATLQSAGGIAVENRPCCQHSRQLSPSKYNNTTSSGVDADDLVPNSECSATANTALTCSCFPSGSQVRRIWLAFRTPEEKADWMASLLSIQWHRFAQPDTSENVVFDNPSSLNPNENVCKFPDSLDSSEEGIDGDDEVLSEAEDFLDNSTSAASAQSTSQLGNPNEDKNPPNLTTITVTSMTHPGPSHPFGGYATVSPRTNSAGYSPLLHPQIRMATLEKLIERLTYPTYFDVRLVNTFLLAYRRVTTPETFLEMLIERFRVPDPEFLPEEFEFDESKGQLESPAQHMLKRFRSGYKKRVQTRVLMVLSRWVRSQRYFQNDFLPNHDLRRRLSEFLASIQVRHLSACVRRIQQYLQTHAQESPPDLASDTNVPRLTLEGYTEVTIRRAGSLSSPVRSTTDSSTESTGLDITAIHPYRLAEQVTLYEWELYRAVQFWEVEGRDRVGNSTPNLDRSKRFSNRFRNWLVYAILAEPHIEDRCVAIKRVIDLMLIMERMNNLQGSQEAKSALISASVFRLRRSFEAIERNKHYREVVARLRRENTCGTKGRHKSPFQSSSCSTGANQTSLFGLPTTLTSLDKSSSSAGLSQSIPTGVLGLPFATRSSKAHERRIKALEKQHASGIAYLPCVPFIAAGVMTRLIHLDLRHPDTITTNSGAVLINCWKHQQLAEVVERYLAFQRIPYSFEVKPDIRGRLEHLDPLEMAGASSESEFEARMYELSMAYEPRDSEPVPENLVSAMDRRLSKEAIEASNLLSTRPLKERMSLHSIFIFEAAIHSASTRGRGPTKSQSRQRSVAKTSSSQQSTCSVDSFEQSSYPLQPTPHVQHRYLPLPNSDVVGNASSIQSSTSPGGIHQHSMSDSLVLSSPKRFPLNVSSPSYHQQTLSAVDMLSHRALDLSPPVTPLCTANYSFHGSARAHSSLPPPLPPRKSQTAGVTTRIVHSPIPLGSTTDTTVMSAPTTPHAKSDSDPRTLHIVQGDYSPRPPPLPPRMSGLNRACLNQPGKSGRTSASPSPNSEGAFVFNLETLVSPNYQPDNIPPPLPPRRTTCNAVRPRSNERLAIAPT
ncbi:RasGEF domain protein, partial [Opisthorchis viverrini]